ncbi:hypothetical protein PXD04_00745 [Methanosphaera sp. ISO3-F5]|uniref:hypothetical protein n=1 Tax=Methanosphaera sp. ISO3-F5 TaxID=1452353 RepID=UPI002B257041|nr:hypothetical protein [Methanosphaera sp. ISO3-F5]WQH64356.1 hypothetical protein PXD04_00745 [Methanosphaera sp. ISO3-F5]
MSSVLKTFNTPISGLYSNMGSYSLIDEINSDNYHNIKNDIDNLSIRIKRGTFVADNPKELYDELLEIKIMNEYVEYIINENYTHENILFGLDLIKTLIQLFDVLILKYLEDNIQPKKYDAIIHSIHKDLSEKEKYFNHHILLDDSEHENHVQSIETSSERVVYENEDDFLEELKQW